MNTTIDKVALTELRLFIDNDADLYRQQTVPIYQNLQKKMDKFTYISDRAALLFFYLVDNGARKYCKQFGGEVRTMFPKPLRQQLARDMAKSFETEFSLGNRW